MPAEPKYGEAESHARVDEAGFRIHRSVADANNATNGTLLGGFGRPPALGGAGAGDAHMEELSALIGGGAGGSPPIAGRHLSSDSQARPAGSGRPGARMRLPSGVSFRVAVPRRSLERWGGGERVRARVFARV